MTRAARAAALLCALACVAAPAAAQTSGLEDLYERYPVAPPGVTATPSPEGPDAPPTAAGASDDDAFGGLPSDALWALGLGLVVAVPVALLAAPAAQRLRPSRRAFFAAPNESFTPVDERTTIVSTVEVSAAVIDLQTAPEQELQLLPGVGPALAQRIVAWRAQNGGFGSVDELAEVRGIGQSRMEALRPYLVATPDAPATAPTATPAAVQAHARVVPRPGPMSFVRRNLNAVTLIGLAVVAEALLIALVVWAFS